VSDAPDGHGRRAVPDDGTAAVARRLDVLLDRLAARRDVPHAIAAVERGDGSLRWRGARGETRPGGPPATPGTPFFVASIDKLLTAAVVLQLAEEGRLGLDARLVDLLPAGLVASLHRMDGVDRTGAITVRHLLSHTSGLPDYLEDAPRGGRSLVDRITGEGDRGWSLEEALRAVRETLRPHFPPQPRDAARPRARYCDTNFLLLRAVAEAVAGPPFPRLVEDRLFRPLGMRHTWVAGHAPLEPAPEPTALFAGDRPLEIPLALRSIGGVFSTTRDLVAFLRGLVSGAIFSRPETSALARARFLRFGLPFDRAAVRAPSWPIEYGLGMMRFRLPRLLTPFRPVPAVLGHTGSTGTWLFHCPQLDLFLCGAVDEVTAGPVPFHFVPRVLGALRTRVASAARR
jgi:D-alanyl-D-alanine carboxypeptidase